MTPQSLKSAKRCSLEVVAVARYVALLCCGGGSADTIAHEGRLRLRAAIRRREMHLTLKRALVEVVDLPFPEPGAHRGPRQRFPRTVEDLAQLAGVTAHYLRHLAADAGLPLGRLLRQHAALRALEMLAAGAAATAVAHCFGYGEASGVRKLIGRNLGGRIGSLVETGLETHYARTVRLVENNGMAR